MWRGMRGTQYMRMRTAPIWQKLFVDRFNVQTIVIISDMAKIIWLDGEKFVLLQP